MEIEPVASFSLTHVHYNPNDRFSYLCAWLALVPQGLCVVYATLIWSAREAEIILMFTGQLACEAFNWCLKRYIKEERPKQMFGKGYGMPSSHAQFVGFFAIYLALFLLVRHDPRPETSHVPTTFLQRLLLSIVAFLCAVAVAVSRIYLSYHTPKQVLVGFVAGSVCAVAWFQVTSILRARGWVDWGLQQPIARLARLRDLVLTEDLQDAGWGRWEARNRKPMQKSAKGKKQ
ncbi:DOLPP1 protein [Eremomyces bilateralis CBS 781.70]|uniref:Dolichyldiphosphatase n=1 Tax=Eremomyces bilateralis CBS 781.70 TaxID=1392243 RepID=A0A6G1FWF2_9PEZI|nr:DOLPP1 protein [Eremomyces bilateralis CBS 781.70]KAF1810010.1 DOLPP1 protein [Eremomyces bilateralis CBS 781.70]